MAVHQALLVRPLSEDVVLLSLTTAEPAGDDAERLAVGGSGWSPVG